MGVAPSSGVYFIQSVANKAQFITLTHSQTVVCLHKGNNLDTQKWTVGIISSDGKGYIINSLRNVASKKYLAVDAKHKLVTSDKAFSWLIRSVDSDKPYVIYEGTSMGAARLPSGRSDGAALTFAEHTDLPIQHWDLLHTN